MARSGPVTRDTSTVALGLAQIRIGNAAANISQIAPVLSSANSIGALGSTKFTGSVDYWKLESGFPMLEDMSIPLRETAMLEATYKEISSFNMAWARGIDPLADTDANSEIVATNSSGGTTTGVITTNNAGGVIDEEWTVVFTSATAGDIYGKTTGHLTSFSVLVDPIAPQNAGASDNPYFTLPGSFFSGTWAADDTFVFRTTPFIAGTAAYADSHAGDIKLGAMVAPAFIRMEAVYTYPNGTNHMYIIFPRANVTSSSEIDMQAEDAAAPPITFEAKRADQDTAGGHSAWDDMPLGRILFD